MAGRQSGWQKSLQPPALSKPAAGGTSGARHAARLQQRHPGAVRCPVAQLAPPKIKHHGAGAARHPHPWAAASAGPVSVQPRQRVFCALRSARPPTQPVQPWKAAAARAFMSVGTRGPSCRQRCPPPVPAPRRAAHRAQNLAAAALPVAGARRKGRCFKSGQRLGVRQVQPTLAGQQKLVRPTEGMVHHVHRHPAAATAPRPSDTGRRPPTTHCSLHIHPFCPGPKARGAHHRLRGRGCTAARYSAICRCSPACAWAAICLGSPASHHSPVSRRRTTVQSRTPARGVLHGYLVALASHRRHRSGPGALPAQHRVAPCRR